MDGVNSELELETVAIELPEEEALPTFVISEDGTVTPVEEEAEPIDLSTIPHTANLAEYLSDEVLNKIGGEIIAEFQQDEQNRADWDRVYRKGIDALPLKVEKKTEPFENASSVRHPMVLEAGINWQSHAISEVFPASGPVVASVLGKMTPEKADKAQRVQDHMNYFLTRRLKHYRGDTEALLLQQGLCGSAFRKWYLNEFGEPDCQFVEPEDFVVNAGATSLYNATRYTHKIAMPVHDMKRKMANSFYRRVELPEPMMLRQSEVKDAKEKAVNASTDVINDTYSVLETHKMTCIEGCDNDDLPKPYVITVEQFSGKVLSIKRNWDEGDPRYTWNHWFVPFIFIPGFDPYGIGLIHTQGQLAEAATSLIRNLINAGAYMNYPAGLTSNRTNKLNSPVPPGTLRQVEGTLEDFSKSIMWLPTPNPSAVHLSLLDNLINEGKRLGANAVQDQIANIGGETNFSTVLALMERGMQIPTAIIARLHHSLSQEFQLLQKLIKSWMRSQVGSEDEEMQYLTLEKDGVIRLSDYDDTITVTPVSDPNASTFAQRILKYQTMLNIFQQNREVFNAPAVLRSFLGVLGIREKDMLVPDQKEIPPGDPATDIANILIGKPVKVFEWQPHEVYFQAAVAAINDPKVKQQIGQMPNGQQVQAQLLSYAAEHFAYMWRTDVAKELGAPLPPLTEPQPAEITSDMAYVVAQAIDQLTKKNEALAQMQRNQQLLQDPVLKMQMEESAATVREKDARAQAAIINAQANAQAKPERETTERLRIVKKDEIDRMALEADLKRINAELEQTDEDTALKLAQIQKLKAEVANILSQIDERLNAPAERPIDRP